MTANASSAVVPATKRRTKRRVVGHRSIHAPTCSRVDSARSKARRVIDRVGGARHGPPNPPTLGAARGTRAAPREPACLSSSLDGLHHEAFPQAPVADHDGAGAGRVEGGQDDRYARNNQIGPAGLETRQRGAGLHAEAAQAVAQALDRGAAEAVAVDAS